MMAAYKTEGLKQAIADYWQQGNKSQAFRLWFQQIDPYTTEQVYLDALTKTNLPEVRERLENVESPEEWKAIARELFCVQ